jgi:hypothetical protein
MQKSALLRSDAFFSILVSSMEPQRTARPWGKFPGLPFGLIAAAMLAYAGLRAVRLSFTFDEAATYISYLSASLLSAFDFTDANNHVLYTLFAKLTSAFGGSSEFVLRLPSLSGFVLYLVFSWAILKRFFGRVFALAGFLLLNLNPYVLDFFSLGRGYGLALGFEMAALYFFLAFLDSTRGERGENERVLEAALLTAWAAALANISFLNVLMSMWVLVFLFSLIRRWLSRSPQPPASYPEEEAVPGRRWVAAAMVLSIPFNLSAVCQYIRFSGMLIDPVAVRVHGLDEGEMPRVLVSGDDIYDREIDFSHQDGVWSTPRILPLKRLKLGFPGAAVEKVRSVDIEIGAKTLLFSPPEIKKWKHFPREGLELFLSDIPAARSPSVFGDMREVMNWKGDDVFIRAIAGEAASVLVIGALFVGLVIGLGRLAVKWRLLRRPEWRPVRDSVCLSALYLSYPIFIMKKSGALYYGGRTGFIKDTVGSLISNSFYGIRYAGRQETAALTFIVGTIVLFLLMLGWGSLRRKNFTNHLEAFSLLAVMAIIALLVLAQRAVFGNPYLMGRTAIFLIPLYSLFLLFFLRDLGRPGGAWRPAASVLLAAVVALSVYHGIRSANVTHTLDWSYDADTKQMIEDVVSLRAEDPAGRPSIRLGVEWHYWPSSEFYRRRVGFSWLDISMLPTVRRCDLLYVPQDIRSTGTRVIIKSYPRTGSVLVE